MKTPEDEAFDELATRQGDWGSGFQTKPWNEDEWRRNNWRCGHGWLRGEQCEICNAAQPAREPVAHVYSFDHEGRPLIAWNNAKGIKIGDKLYTAPPKREWVGLTDEEYDEIWRMDLNNKDIMDKTIAKLKEKNT